MTAKRKPLTRVQYECFTMRPHWGLTEFPPCLWEVLPIERPWATLALFGSADIDNPQFLHGIPAIAGFDHLVVESRPRPGEPLGNAYHYVIQESYHPDYPYILWGSYYDDTRIEHWFECEDLDVYTIDDEQFK